MKTDLSHFLPEPALLPVNAWISEYDIEVRISKNRSTKLGDYHCPTKKSGHRISINVGLNKYGFLLTFLHEFAHLLVWNEYGNKGKPHGKLWKNQFSRLINIMMELKSFPNDMNKLLKEYLKNPTATSTGNYGLVKAMRKYNNSLNNTRLLEDLKKSAIFKISGGRTFQKGERIRKRYKCVEIASKKTYLFSPVAEVYLPD